MVKSNVKLKSNVMPRGHVGFESQVRGAASVRKLLLKRMPGYSLQNDNWSLLRHAEGLTPTQIIELEWGEACVECGAIPEGLRKGAIEFHCPKRKCVPKPIAARLVYLDPDLFQVVRTASEGIDALIQTVLEQFGAAFLKSARLPSRPMQFPVYVRLTRLQELFYTGWTPVEFSDHVEHCLREFFGADGHS
jgi:hypothetical protein